MNSMHFCEWQKCDSLKYSVLVETIPRSNSWMYFLHCNSTAFLQSPLCSARKKNPQHSCVCVCQNEKESARRMASTTSENRKRNEKKSTEQEEAHFVSRVTVILTREKEGDYLLNLHMSQSTCFGT